ncbi:MAG: hypothetical protein ACK5OH_00850, partial [bacterium]
MAVGKSPLKTGVQTRQIANAKKKTLFIILTVLEGSTQQSIYCRNAESNPSLDLGSRQSNELFHHPEYRFRLGKTMEFNCAFFVNAHPIARVSILLPGLISDRKHSKFVPMRKLLSIAVLLFFVPLS